MISPDAFAKEIAKGAMDPEYRTKLVDITAAVLALPIKDQLPYIEKLIEKKIASDQNFKIKGKAEFLLKSEYFQSAIHHFGQNHGFEAAVQAGLKAKQAESEVQKFKAELQDIQPQVDKMRSEGKEYEVAENINLCAKRDRIVQTELPKVEKIYKDEFKKSNAVKGAWEEASSRWDEKASKKPKGSEMGSDQDTKRSKKPGLY